MKKEELQNYINDGKSIREISKETKKSFSSIRYWLKKFEIKTIFNECNKGKSEIEGIKFCPNCKEHKKIEDFYPRYIGRTDYLSTYCKKCWSDLHKKRLNNLKIKMIEYKGGKCVKCGLELKDSHYSVFDFHHIDPSIKDVNYKRLRNSTFERVKKEIDKCVLLCSNCHRITHSKGDLAQY